MLLSQAKRYKLPCCYTATAKLGAAAQFILVSFVASWQVHRQGCNHHMLCLQDNKELFDRITAIEQCLRDNKEVFDRITAAAAAAGTPETTKVSLPLPICNADACQFCRLFIDMLAGTRGPRCHCCSRALAVCNCAMQDVVTCRKRHNGVFAGR